MAYRNPRANREGENNNGEEPKKRVYIPRWCHRVPGFSKKVLKTMRASQRKHRGRNAALPIFRVGETTPKEFWKVLLGGPTAKRRHKNVRMPVVVDKKKRR